MKILFVNKFLYPNGGSETYMFRLGEQFSREGHEVQYFGMEHEGRVVGNRAESYTRNMDFHAGNGLSKLTYPLKTIYSFEARKKIRRVLDDFQPDVAHLNNFNYQLTPSVIVEIDRWRKQTGKNCRIVYTAHDYQLLCPNHMLYNPTTRRVCEKCLVGRFSNCVKGKCIHGSTARSAIGMLEARYWNGRNIYRQIDTIVCCSEFLKRKMDANSVFQKKTVALHNFIQKTPAEAAEKKDYVLYFGRFSEEKGIRTLITACRELSEIPFVFAGDGPLAQELTDVSNARNVGFQKGDALKTLIREARFAVYPSEWYENCPLSVMEAIALGTPVVGANIGGIPELIEDKKTGVLFPSGDKDALKDSVRALWEDRERCDALAQNCLQYVFDDAKTYAEKLTPYYVDA